jgi:hypothetical protein
MSWQVAASVVEGPAVSVGRPRDVLAYIDRIMEREGRTLCVEHAGRLLRHAVIGREQFGASVEEGARLLETAAQEYTDLAGMGR